MSIGGWSARAGSMPRILPRARRISSIRRAGCISAKSCARTPSFASPRIICSAASDAMAPEDDVDLAVRSLFALSVQLGDKPYLMGETPCGTDATAFGALAGILTPFFESPLRQRTEQFANLTAYVDRMMLRYYPEFAWAPLQASGVTVSSPGTAPSPRPALPRVRRYGRPASPAPARHRQHRTSAGCAAGNWCPRPKS